MAITNTTGIAPPAIFESNLTIAIAPFASESWLIFSANAIYGNANTYTAV